MSQALLSICINIIYTFIVLIRYWLMGTGELLLLSVIATIAGFAVFPPLGLIGVHAVRRMLKEDFLLDPADKSTTPAARHISIFILPAIMVLCSYIVCRGLHLQNTFETGILIFLALLVVLLFSFGHTMLVSLTDIPALLVTFTSAFLAQGLLL